MLEQTALRIGLLASPPPAEQMEALLDGLLTPDESMIRGPDGMEPLSWRREAEPDVLFLEAAHGGMELAGELQTEADPLPVVLLVDNYEQVLDGYRLSVKRCLMMPPERERLEEILRFCRGAYGRKSFRVPLPSGETCVIQLGEILWFRGCGHKILIYTEGRAGQHHGQYGQDPHLGAHRRGADRRKPGPGIPAEARAGAEPVHGINTPVYAIEGRVL